MENRFEDAVVERVKQEYDLQLNPARFPEWEKDGVSLERIEILMERLKEDRDKVDQEHTLVLAICKRVEGMLIDGLEEEISGLLPEERKNTEGEQEG